MSAIQCRRLAVAVLLSMSQAFLIPHAMAAPKDFDRTVVVDGGGYFPVLIRLANGDLLAVHRGGGAHIGRRGRLDLVRSTDEGKTWSEPWTVPTTTAIPPSGSLPMGPSCLPAKASARSSAPPSAGSRRAQHRLWLPEFSAVGRRTNCHPVLSRRRHGECSTERKGESGSLGPATRRLLIES